MPDYGSDIAMHNDDAALRLMLDDPLNEKMPALIAYVQYGIDLHHMVLLGQTWPDGGGHRPGQKLPMTFASTLFADQQMQTVIQEATFFHEDGGNYTSDVTGEALFGFHHRYWSEQRYWAVIETGGGFRSHADPYGYIDGGPVPGGSYQFCCVFFLRMLHGADYVPPDPVGIFADVPLDGWQAKWIEAAYNAALIPACETEPGLMFCPEDPLERAMGAYMMAQAKELK